MQALLILTLFFLQAEEKFIPRVSKDPYLAAVRELNKASDLISEDPQATIDRVTNILSSTKVKYFEVRLKIEVQPQVPEYHDFFPYQVRGRARIELAKKAVLDTAINILKAAVDDLKLSTDKKVPGSSDLLKTAEDALAVKQKEKADIEREKNNPFTKFKNKFDDLVGGDKYRSAMALLGSSEGQTLTQAERDQLSGDCEQRCADFRDSKLSKFKSALGVSSVQELRDGGDSGFTRNYAQYVPAETELTEKAVQDPTLQWSRKHLKTVKAVVSNQGKIDDLLAAATEALKLDPPDTEMENPCFKGTAMLASELCQKAIAANTNKAESATKTDREKLQAAADQVFAQWKAFTDGLDENVKKRHADLGSNTERLSDAAKSFPVEIAQLASYNIDNGFTNDPGAEFKKIEDGLLNLVSDLPSMGKVAIESRQELYTKLITAGTLRRIIEGMSEEQIVRDWAEYRGPLIKAGGPIKPDRYGPKVKRVFDRLLKT